MNRDLPWITMVCMPLSLALLTLSVLTWQRRQSGRHHRSHVNADLLRPPGAHLLRQLVEQQRVRWWSGAACAVIPLVFLSLHLAQSSWLNASESLWRWILNGFTATVCLHHARTRYIQAHEHCRKLALSLEATQAIGQELDQLMRHGAVVFHGLPADRFVIDHVVICAAGVFALETKARPQRRPKHGLTSGTVVFNGSHLKFPDWTESKPLFQTERQAAWLAKWLTTAVGKPIDVTGVLVLPGWTIDRQARGTAWVINGFELDRLLSSARGKTVLDGPMIYRIASAVEQRCRAGHQRPSAAPATTPIPNEAPQRA